MPHRSRVDGIVSSTKPLSLRGQLVDKIRVEFKDGEVINATAEKGQQALRDPYFNRRRREEVRRSGSGAEQQ